MTLGYTVQSIDEHRFRFGRGKKSMFFLCGLEGGLEGITGGFEFFKDGAGMREIGTGIIELCGGENRVGTGKEVHV